MAQTIKEIPLEELHQEALKYKTRKAFLKGSPKYYRYASRHKLLPLITGHMPKMAQSDDMIKDWPYERFHEVALQCKSLAEFKRKHGRAYDVARQKGFLQKLKTTMREQGVWTNPLYITDEICEKEALKYKSRKEFAKKASGIYEHAQKAGIMDRICKHMKPEQPQLQLRQLYLIEFPGKVAYIGAAGNPKDRFRQHHSGKSPVHDYIDKTGLNPKLTILSEPMQQDLAFAKEKKLIAQYISNGYHLLNKSKGGERGYSTNAMTNDEIIQIASQYKSRGEFQKKNKRVYQLACIRGILDKACAHMPKNLKKIYTEEKLQEVLAGVESLRELEDKDIRAYDLIIKYHRQAEFFIRQGRRWVKKPLEPFYSLEELQAEASKYESRTEFQNKGTKYYNYALRHHIIDEVCSMLPKRKKIKSKYTIDMLDKIVAGCKDFMELHKKYSGAEKAIRREHLEDRYFQKIGRHKYLKRPPYQ